MKLKFVSEPKFGFPYGLKKFFTKKFIMEHYGVIPVLGCVGFGAVLTGGFVLYFCFTKDFRLNKSRPHLHEIMDLLHPWSLKLICRHKLPVLEELHDTFEKMKAEERRRKRDENCD